MLHSEASFKYTDLKEFMNKLSKYYELSASADVQEFYHSRGWTDGFPIVPPTPDAVAACLDWVNMSADELIGIEPVRERPVIAEKLEIGRAHV